MTWLAAALALLPQLLFPILALSPLLRRVTRRGQVRVARVLTELLEQLGHPLLQLRDASVLLGKNRVLRHQLGLELRDPIVSPVALHELGHDRSAGGWKELSNLWSKVDHLHRSLNRSLGSRRRGLNGYSGTSLAKAGATPEPTSSRGDRRISLAQASPPRVRPQPARPQASPDRPNAQAPPQIAPGPPNCVVFACPRPRHRRHELHGARWGWRTGCKETPRRRSRARRPSPARRPGPETAWRRAPTG